MFDRFELSVRCEPPFRDYFLAAFFAAFFGAAFFAAFFAAAFLAMKSSSLQDRYSQCVLPLAPMIVGQDSLPCSFSNLTTLPSWR